VPSVGVHGRYLTSGSLAGDNVRSLSVADFLVDKIRRGA
jgi:thiol:disulfide interchange protein DsbA